MPRATKKKTQPPVDTFWNSTDTQLMVTAAHRYCLGRSSYIVGAAIDWLWEHRKSFTRNTLRVIVRDTVEALQDGHAGWESIDVPGWKRLASKLFHEMVEEDQAWVMREVAHRHKPWPLDGPEKTVGEKIISGLEELAERLESE